LVYIFRDIVQAVSESVLPDIIANNPDVEITAEQINYKFGSWKEITNTLNEWASSPDLAPQKFPMVVLIEDWQLINSANDDYNSCTIQLFILMSTDPNYDSFQRQYKVFDPILEPIYDALINELYNCGYFHLLDVNRDTPHVKINRKSLGKETLAGLKTDDYLDAIQIKDLKLKLYKTVY